MLTKAACSSWPLVVGRRMDASVAGAVVRFSSFSVFFICGCFILKIMMDVF